MTYKIFVNVSNCYVKQAYRISWGDFKDRSTYFVLRCQIPEYVIYHDSKECYSYNPAQSILEYLRKLIRHEDALC